MLITGRAGDCYCLLVRRGRRRLLTSHNALDSPLSPPQQQRTIWPSVPTGPRLRTSVLEELGVPLDGSLAWLTSLTRQKFTVDRFCIFAVLRVL